MIQVLVLLVFLKEGLESVGAAHGVPLWLTG